MNATDPLAVTASVLLQNMPALLGSLIAAIIGGLFVLFGVLLAAKKARETERDRDRQEIENLRKALLVEIDTLVERYHEGIGHLLEANADNTPFICIFPVYERYFVVYEENAHLIGKIPDDAERELIVRGYMLAKGILDSYRLNNSMTEKLNYAIGLGPVILGSKALHVQTGIEQMMREYTPVLKKMHTDVLALHQRLRESLQRPVHWE